MACAFVPSQWLRIIAALGLLGLYGYYVKLKFSDDESDEATELDPLLFAKRSATPVNSCCSTSHSANSTSFRNLTVAP